MVVNAMINTFLGMILLRFQVVAKISSLVFFIENIYLNLRPYKYHKHYVTDYIY